MKLNKNVSGSDASKWSIPAVFSWLHKEGRLSEEEMARTFNCGLGAVLVVAPPDAQRVLRQLQGHEEAWIVGSLVHKQPGKKTMIRDSDWLEDKALLKKKQQ